MTAKEQLNNNVNQVEIEIEDILLKLKVMNLFQDRAEKIKEEYEKIRNNYYEQRLVTFTEEGTITTELMVTATAKYAVSIENDILPQLKELYEIASAKQIALSINESGKINIEDIRKVLDKVSNINFKTSKYNDEIKELKDYLKEFFYGIIKKDAEENNRFEIINMLYDYKDKGCDFVTGVSRLFLQEVSDIFKATKNKETIELVKMATVDEFNKDDIVALLIATGKKTIEVVDKKNTIDFTEAIQKFERILYTDRKNDFGDKCTDLGLFVRRYKVNPLPKTEGENLILRGYDLTILDYARTSGNWRKKEKNYKPDLEGVDLSYTNAVIVPRYLGITSLRGANLEGVDLRGVDLTGIDIEGANLLKTGADIRYCKGTCLGVSAYEDHRVFVSDKKITPMKFQELTGYNPFSVLCKASNKDEDFDNVGPWHNRVLRQYDMSCVDLSYEYINEGYHKQTSSKLGCGKCSKWNCEGLDYSYTNINIDPQEFRGGEKMVLNLEGVDLRDKDFTGVERYFVKCNLKGTGANIDPKYNHTVSEYVVGSNSKTR